VLVVSQWPSPSNGPRGLEGPPSLRLKVAQPLERAARLRGATVPTLYFRRIGSLLVVVLVLLRALWPVYAAGP